MRKSGESLPEPLFCKKFSGRFMLRIPIEVLRDLVIQAEDEGISLNQLVSAKLSQQ